MAEEPIKVRVRFHVATGRTGHKELRDGPAPEAPIVAKGHVPRISRLMALAIRFDQLIRDGVIHDQADLARLALVSRARVTQIMDLLTLGPDIQEAILFLPLIQSGRDPVKLGDVKPLIASPDWSQQRCLWKSLAVQP